MSTKPITIRVDDEELKVLDRLTRSRGYKNRSETVRELLNWATKEAQYADLRAEAAESMRDEKEQRALREVFEEWEDLRAW